MDGGRQEAIAQAMSNLSKEAPMRPFATSDPAMVYRNYHNAATNARLGMIPESKNPVVRGRPQNPLHSLMK
jgi:hypothetical protein